MSTSIAARLARHGQPSLVVPLSSVALATGVVLAIALSMTADDADRAFSAAAQSDDYNQLPTGAGSQADGVIDEPREGLFNDTSTGDLIDQSAASDLLPPLLERDNQGVNPASSVEDLEPASGAEKFTVIDRARE
jgi:hypothetical protein